MSQPYVSVLVDTYNHERYLAQAIVSVFEQDFPAADREIVVVDDGSTDRTPEILAKFAPQIRVLRKPNGGQASAFNVGIPECRGEIIAFLDGDDWWAPAKLTYVIPAFTEFRGTGIVGHGITEVLPNGSRQVEAVRCITDLDLRSVDGARAFRARKQFFGTSRMTVRADLLRKILPIPVELRIEADEYIFTLAVLYSSGLILPEVLAFYRLHGANHYQMAGASPEGLRRKQAVLQALAAGLGESFRAAGAPSDVARAVIEIVQAEADQLRLILDGGYPWETVSTEWTIYRVMHESPPWRHLLFRFMTMIPAAVLPPSWFYFARRRLAASDAYGRLRRVLFPVPEPTHVQRFRGTGA